MRLSREKLREVASQFLERARSTGSEADQRAALVFSAAALRMATRRSGTFTQDALPECIQHASILGDMRDAEGSTFLLGASAAAVLREPFPDEERNLLLLDYLANEAAGLPDKRAAASIRRAHLARLVGARGASSPEAAEAGMALAQARSGETGEVPASASAASRDLSTSFPPPSLCCSSRPRRATSPQRSRPGGARRRRRRRR